MCSLVLSLSFCHREELALLSSARRSRAKERELHARPSFQVVRLAKRGEE